jgi:inner membrane protein
MEPVTHTLASVALAQAGLNRTTRLAVPMAIVAGLAADADLFSLAGGAPAYLEYHRTFSHSLLGATVIAAIVPLPFVAMGRSGWYRRQYERGGELRAEDSVRGPGAVITCLAAALLHLLLDWLNPYGIQAFWPQHKWYALDLLDPVDPWLLVGMLVMLVVPILLRLVTEEIGAKREGKSGFRGAVLALAFLAGYCGVRWVMHERAVDLLFSHRFHDALPRRASAFPASASPSHWMGIVDTENTTEEIEFRLGGYFDPDRSSTNYKPEATASIDTARDTPSVRKFLAFARYPSATVVSLPEGRGVRVEIRDLRFTRPAGAEVRPDVIAIVELDPQMRVVLDALLWAKDYKR